MEFFVPGRTELIGNHTDHQKGRVLAAAVSAGIIDDVPMLDLCYAEDSRAMVDLNCVMTERGELIEIQGTGEGRPFTLEEQQTLVRLCRKGIEELTAMQKKILEEAE